MKGSIIKLVAVAGMAFLLSGTTYIIQENGVEVGRYEEHDGSDEVKVIGETVEKAAPRAAQQDSAAATEPAKKGLFGAKEKIKLPWSQSRQMVKVGFKKVRLDVYNPDKRNAPVVIVLHGDAGIEGDRAARYQRFGSELMKDGFIAINIYYHDVPEAKWVDAVRKTLDFVETITGASSRRMGIVGYSSGGTVALRTASKDKRLAAIAINAGYLPVEFKKTDVRGFPVTYFTSGSQDRSMETLEQLEQWYGEFNQKFIRNVHSGGHRITLEMFWREWNGIRRFFREHL